MSDKVDYREKFTRDNEGHTIMTKRADAPRSDSNPKCICTKQRSFKIHEIKQIELQTDKTGKFNSTPLKINKQGHGSAQELQQPIGCKQ